MADIEIEVIPDEERKRRVSELLPDSDDRMRLTPAIFRRAEELEKLGFKPADAVHVAAAEASEADVLLTCDDRLLRRGRRLRKKLRIEIENPIHWLQEHADAPDT